MKQRYALILCACMLTGCAKHSQKSAPTDSIEPSAVPVRTGTVVCVGDSITYGAGVSETLETETWPIQLQNMLGSDYNVINCGINGRTLLKEGDYPYTENPAYQVSLTSDADIVLIMLGTNDSKPQNWNAELYEAELCEMIRIYQALDSSPDVYAMTCPDVIVSEGQNSGSFGVDQSVVEEQLPDLIQRASETAGAGLIDIYSLTKDRADCFSLDGVHTNAEGNRIIAQAVFQALTNGK
ncbi:MAG: lipase [Erysipelotrichia bacterium]|nr:lipase [Erysipelotrichia bacterium]